MALDDEDLFDPPARPRQSSNKIVYQPPGAQWSLDRLPEVESLYQSSFKKRLPLVNRGQGSIHNKWGYDHRNSADVSINPATPEGQQFTEQLKKANVPFVAFTGAIPGVATGPHIHIGFPSHRTQQKFNVGAQKKSKGIASDDLFDSPQKITTEPDDDLFDSPEQSTPRASAGIRTPPRATAAPATPSRYSFSGRAFGQATPEQQAQIRAGVREFEQPSISVPSNAGMGTLRQMDEPEVKRITRIQKEVAKDPLARLSPIDAAQRAADLASREREDELKAQANEPRLQELTQVYRKQIQQAKGLGIGPEQWLNEAAAKGAAGLVELAAGAFRGASPVLAIASRLLGDPNRADIIALHAQAMQRAAEEEGADRNRVSKTIQNVVGGTIASAPEMAMVSMGAPPMAAFGAGGAARSLGRGDRPVDVARAGAHGVATGGAFELPLPQIANPVARTLTRAGTTGVATGGLEAQQGATPDQAIEAGLTNALMSGYGEASRIRNEPSSLARGLARETPRERVEPNAEIAARLRGEQRDTQAKVQPPVETQRAEVESGPAIAEAGSRRMDVPTRSKVVAPETRAADTQLPTKPETALISRAQTSLPKPIWEMSPKELEMARDAEIASEREMLTQYLGKDAQRFIDLNHQRLRGVAGADEKLNQLMSRLNAEQERTINDWYAESERRPLPDDYNRHLRNLREIEGLSGSEKDMAELMAREIPKLGVGKESKYRVEREEAALAESRIRYAAQVVREAGLDRQKLLALTKERAERLYGPDTEFMLSSLFNVEQAATSSTLQRFFHRDYGEVTESPNQKQVGKNRVRVVDENGREHVIKRAAMTGRGNERAVPIRESQPIERVAETENVGEVADVNTASSATSPWKVPREPLSAKSVTEPATNEPSTTSARKSQLAQDRAELDLPELPPAERKSWQQSLAEAKPESAQRLADEVLNRPRALNDSETASLVVKAQQVKNEHQAKLREIENAQEADLPRLKSELDVLEGEFDRLTQAARASGTEKGRALAAQKLTINQDFDLVSLVSRFKADAGRDPSPAERTRIEQLSRRNSELEAQLVAANDKLAYSRLQSEIDRVSRRQRRTQTKQSLDEEFAQLRQQFAQARAEARNVQASGLAGLDPEGQLTRLIGKMARNRIQAGVTDAAQLVDDIHAVIAEHLPNVSKREVRDAISGYAIGPRSTRSELQRQIDTLKSELKSLSKTEDIKAGVRSPYREGPRQSEARRLPMEGPRKSEERSSGIPRQGPRVSDARKLPAQGPRLEDVPRAGPKLSDVRRVAEQGPRRSDVNRLPMQGSRLEDAPRQGPRLSDMRKLPAEGPRMSESTERKAGPRLTDAPLQGPKLSDVNRLKAEGPQMVQHGPPKAPFSRDQARQRAIQKQIADLESQMKAGEFRDRPQREPPRYTRETYRLQKQLEDVRLEYERMKYRATASPVTRLGHEAVKVVNALKTLKSIGDVSAMLRQGGFYGISHPVEGLLKPTREMIRSFTDMGYRNVEAAIRNDPVYDTLKRAGVEFTGVERNNPHLSVREEGFFGKEYLQYIPGVKQVVNFSERTFVSFLDTQRLLIGKQMIEGLPESQRGNPKELQAIAKLINAGTGRGNLGKKGNQAAPLLNLAIFSPRLLVSRIQLLNNMISPRKLATTPPGARSRMIKDNVKFVGATMAALGLAKAAGMSVNLNPNDADFLKIRAGNTTYDTLTGLQQPLRYLINMGRAIEADVTGSETYSGRTKAELSGRFARSKLSPAAGIGLDYILGKDYMSKPFSLKNEAKEAVMPLPAKDVVEAFQNEGLWGAIKATPTFTGIGVSNYPYKPYVNKKVQRIGLESDVRTGRKSAAELSEMVRRGDITEAQKKQILTDAKVSEKQARFSNTPAATALDRYERMDAAQREEVREQMEKKAYNLTHSDTLTDQQKAEFQQRLDRLGIVPRGPKKSSGSFKDLFRQSASPF